MPRVSQKLSSQINHIAMICNDTTDTMKLSYY